MNELYRSSGGVPYVLQLTDDTPKNVPIWNKNGLFKIWHSSEIFMGQDFVGPGNQGRYVPNVGDQVWDEVKGTRIVESIDPYTLIPVLRRPTVVDIGGADKINVLLGVGPQHPQEGYFLFVDPNTKPYTATFDSMAIFYQAESRYIRIFKGSVLDDVNPICISAWYDQTGQYVNDKIPLLKYEGSTRPDHPNSFWMPAVGGLTELPKPGEVVTVVCYNDNNKEVSITTWVVNYGSSYRGSFSGVKVIESIELLSPYLRENNTIVLPVGTLIQSASPMCKVTYNDGKERILPIDGTKVKLSGEYGLVASQPGVDYPVSLFYYLDKTEQMSGSSSNGGSKRAQVIHYNVRVDATAARYGVRIFSYPEWVNENRGYKLRHFMQTIERDTVYEVTDKVEINVNSAVWDPLLYGEKQRITFSLDIHEVDPRFNGYRHAQTSWFSLMGPPADNRDTSWLVQFSPGQSPEYGYNLVCKLSYNSSQVWETDVSSGFKVQSDWLKALYESSLPLYSISEEDDIPQPTHFYVVIEGFRYRRNLSDWNKTFVTKSGAHMGELAIIHWCRDVNGIELNLSTSGMMIRQNIKP